MPLQSSLRAAHMIIVKVMLFIHIQKASESAQTVLLLLTEFSQTEKERDRIY